MSAFRQGKVPPAKKEQMTDPAVTDKLISNLKQQVACLELELKYVKEKGNEVKPPPQNAVVSTSTEFRATHGDVLRRASELEAEVFRLKERFAEREKEHALEVAQLRGSIEVGGLTRAQGHAQTLRGELERRTTEFTTEIASQKERHVQEVVALQKTVERLEADKASHETELLSVLKEKNALVNELLQLRDTLRSTQSSLEGSERQRNELSQMLSSEQEKRRQLEIDPEGAAERVRQLQEEQRALMQQLMAQQELLLQHQSRLAAGVSPSKSPSPPPPPAEGSMERAAPAPVTPAATSGALRESGGVLTYVVGDVPEPPDANELLHRQQKMRMEEALREWKRHQQLAATGRQAPQARQTTPPATKKTFVGHRGIAAGQLDEEDIERLKRQALQQQFRQGRTVTNPNVRR